VAAADGSTQDYTVTVSVALNPAKDITSYSINGHGGVIEGNYIYVPLPYTTDVTNLVASFTTTGQSVKVGTTLQTSGVTHNDFTGYWPPGLVYTVAAEDGTTQEWYVCLVLGAMGTLGPMVGGECFATDGSGIIFSNDPYTIYRLTIATDSSVDLLPLMQPRNIAYANSRIYYTSAYHNRLYYISANGGGNTVMFAGSESGAAGNTDGDGFAASFNDPRGIATDGTYLYIADRGNKSIRKVLIASPYTVTTLQAAGFADPTGITLYGSYLYVSDGSGQRILRVDRTTGSVTAVAGLNGTSGFVDDVGASARFNGLNQLVCDGTYLYVIDEGNDALRRVTIDTARADYGRVITLACHTHSGGILGPGNPCKYQTTVSAFGGVTIVGGIVYFGDFSSPNVIRKLQ
jgi:hypothetical protein